MTSTTCRRGHGVSERNDDSGKKTKIEEPTKKIGRYGIHPDVADHRASDGGEHGVADVLGGPSKLAQQGNDVEFRCLLIKVTVRVRRHNSGDIDAMLFSFDGQ